MWNTFNASTITVLAYVCCEYFKVLKHFPWVHLICGYILSNENYFPCYSNRRHEILKSDFWEVPKWKLKHINQTFHVPKFNKTRLLINWLICIVVWEEVVRKGNFNTIIFFVITFLYIHEFLLNGINFSNFISFFWTLSFRVTISPYIYLGVSSRFTSFFHTLPFRETLFPFMNSF